MSTLPSQAEIHPPEKPNANGATDEFDPEIFPNFFSEFPTTMVSSAGAASFSEPDFGSDFFFGSATAAFQIEGGRLKGGRKDSIWDVFADLNNDFLPYSEDAVNHHGKFREDVELMKQIGFNAYRFSISWSRVLPSGKIEAPDKDGKIGNREGIRFYRELLQLLKESGIKPFVTLFHWDTPLALQLRYHGFLSRKIVEDFGGFAKLCFDEFGDLVDRWITLNEPFSFAYSGHVEKVHAPGLGTVNERLFNIGTNKKEDGGSRLHPSRQNTRDKPRKKLTIFDATNDFTDTFAYPYLVTHNMLLAHGKAVDHFRVKYPKEVHPEKKIGITLVSMWFEPHSPTDELDKKAARRALDFFLGWYLDPLVHGDYPDVMKKSVKKGHLPIMTEEDKALIHNKYDFIGVNYYTARFVSHKESKNKHLQDGRNYITDQNLKYYETGKFESGGKKVPIGTDKGGSACLISYPQGIRKLLVHIRDNYKDPLMYITENGIDDHDHDCSRKWDSIYVYKRVNYIRNHLDHLLEAIKVDKVNVKGYFAWSLLDNFEWNNRFTVRFGITYVDYTNGSKRYPKLSAAWLKHFLANRERTELGANQIEELHE